MVYFIAPHQGQAEVKIGYKRGCYGDVTQWSFLLFRYDEDQAPAVDSVAGEPDPIGLSAVNGGRVLRQCRYECG